MNAKRFIVCILGGIISAGICVGGMKSGGNIEVTTPILLSSSGNRILIGFVIGISSWKIHYLLHGALIGLIVTFSSSIVIIPENISGFLMYTVAGIVYGFLIELFATKIFKTVMV